jgi:hypothetical protein
MLTANIILINFSKSSPQLYKLIFGQMINVMSLSVMIEEELNMFPRGLNHVSSSVWHTTACGNSSMDRAFHIAGDASLVGIVCWF